MKSKKILWIILTLLGVVFFVFGGFIVYKYFNSSSQPLPFINTDDDDEKIDWPKYKESKIELDKSFEINKGGVYNLSGNINDGIITVNTMDNVKLIFNNVNVKNNKGPALYIVNASDVVIELANNSINYLEDGIVYEGYDINTIGTVFSHDDITFTGNGTLNIKANNEDAIVSKDDLKIVSGTYNITSVDDAIRGKDSVYIKNGNINIKSKGDGIKSTNINDVNKGFILVENGKINVESDFDSITAATKLMIKNGKFNLKSGLESNLNDEILSKKSMKGIKASENLIIEDGIFELNSLDDSIHCDKVVTIKNGVFNINSRAKGISSNNTVTIDNGSVNLVQSYEGLEALNIIINGGNVKIRALDDGVSVAPSISKIEETEIEETNGTFTMNSGNVYLDVDGDAIDVKGSVNINNGFLEINGSKIVGKGIFDITNDLLINGGSVLASAVTGKEIKVNQNSSVISLIIGFDKQLTNTDTVTVVNSKNEEIISYNSDKMYSLLMISSSKLVNNEEYIININNNFYKKVSLSSNINTVGKVINQNIIVED